MSWNIFFITTLTVHRKKKKTKKKDKKKEKKKDKKQKKTVFLINHCFQAF